MPVIAPGSVERRVVAIGVVIEDVLPAGLAQAQGRRAQGDPWHRIAHYDKNEDGKISKEELSQCGLPR